MIAIYSDSSIIDAEWIPHIRFGDSIQIYHSFDQYRDSSHDRKIAFTAHRLHCTYDQDCAAYQRFEEKVIELSAESDLVFSLESELHRYHWSIWGTCHRPNVYWVQPGTVNDSPMRDHIMHWADFFKLNSALYKKLPDKLAQLEPYKPKPMYFDALLGILKPHRQFVYDHVKEHKLEDKFVMPYGGRWKNDEFYAQDYFVWEPGCEPEQQIIGTADSVNYCGVSTPLSHVMPIDVYNRTAYSVVCETDHDNTLSFFSEKTAKVLIARRLFVVFTGYKFLQNLRELGFKTFDGIIDESYDQIKHDKDRYTAAFEQVKRLCELDQSWVLEQARPILEHNHSLIMNTDWTRHATDQIQFRIDQTLANIDSPTWPTVHEHDRQDEIDHL
jgi:hypothetical protein